TSGGWRIENGESYFSFVAFWPKRQNRRPAPRTSRSLRNVPSAAARCASSNVSPPDKFAIRQRSQFLSPSILLSDVPIWPYACSLWRASRRCAFSYPTTLFQRLNRGRTQQMCSFDLNSDTDFGQTCTWLLPTPTHSAIEYP